MTQRILLSGSRIAMSYPGYDVISPPQTTPEYLSMDSSFAAPERLITVGTRSFASGGSTFFPAQATAPFVAVFIINGATIIESGFFYNGIAAGSPFEVQVFTDHFNISYGSLTGYIAATSIIYFVFKP